MLIICFSIAIAGLGQYAMPLKEGHDMYCETNTLYGFCFPVPAVPPEVNNCAQCENCNTECVNGQTPIVYYYCDSGACQTKISDSGVITCEFKCDFIQCTNIEKRTRHEIVPKVTRVIQ
jgi:hypothetical protein